MKTSDLLRVSILFLFLCCYCELQGQTTVWSEDFSTYTNGTISGTGSGASPVNWNSQSGAAVSGGAILASNTRNAAGSSLANPLIWTTDPIDISPYTSIDFSLDTGAFNVGDFENTGGNRDNFTLEYRIDGGSWIQVFSQSGSASQPISPSYTISGLSGLTLEIRASFHNTATNENYTIDNVLVIGNSATPNQPPVLIATGDQQYCPGGMVPVVQTISITDPDDTTAFAAAIQISSGYVPGEDLLTLTGTHPSITATWSVVEGKLTLTGPALLAEFEAAVSAVQYSSSAPSPSGNRGFSITVGDANYLPPTGHYYEFVAVPGITWTDARNAAAARTYYGLQGYLATLTSQAEADFSGSQALGVGWIGASDNATEGDWQWVTGPEAGTSFWSGGVAGTELTYAFWNANEPNDFPDGPITPGEENYAHITDPSVTSTPGSWNDLPNAGGGGAYAPQGYVVEYGGTPGDPILNVSDNTSITIDNTAPTASNPAAINVFCAADVPPVDIGVVTDEADNCTVNPIVTFLNETSNGGSNPEIITRTYRVSDQAGNNTDVSQTINVFPVLILSEPLDATILVNQNAIFTVSTQNTNTYQWQVSTNAGVSFTNILDGPEYSGTSASSMTVINPGIDKNGYLFRVLVNNSASFTCIDVASLNASLVVRPPNMITNRRITYRVNKN
jgi:hypothetical protein